MKDKNHIFITVGAEWSFDKTQYSFMTKIMGKLWIQDIYFNIIKAVCSELMDKVKI